MEKYKLQSKIKTKGTAYLYWLCLGGHYLYFRKYFTQILYWLTLGGCGVWAFIDFFTMGSKVNKYNAKIYQRIDEIEKREFDKSLEILKASK